MLSPNWSFMINAHARTISDGMVGSTFEHNVDCLEPLHISTRCDFHLPYYGISPYFIDEMI